MNEGLALVFCHLASNLYPPTSDIFRQQHRSTYLLSLNLNLNLRGAQDPRFFLHLTEVFVTIREIVFDLVHGLGLRLPAAMGLAGNRDWR
jgi:hypothetical protein